MSGIRNYLVDTDIFIDWFKGFPQAKNLFINPPGRLYYSRITWKELMLMPGISTSEKNRFSEFLSCFRLIQVDSQIATEAENLHKIYKISNTDALIASTAIIKKMILVTRNIKHFKHIENLELYEINET